MKEFFFDCRGVCCSVVCWTDFEKEVSGGRFGQRSVGESGCWPGREVDTRTGLAELELVFEKGRHDELGTVLRATGGDVQEGVGGSARRLVAEEGRRV